MTEQLSELRKKIKPEVQAAAWEKAVDIIQNNPENLIAITPEMVRRVSSLVEGVDVDLDKVLLIEDE